MSQSTNKRSNISAEVHNVSSVWCSNQLDFIRLEMSRTEKNKLSFIKRLRSGILKKEDNGGDRSQLLRGSSENTHYEDVVLGAGIDNPSVHHTSGVSEDGSRLLPLQRIVTQSTSSHSNQSSSQPPLPLNYPPFHQRAMQPIRVLAR